MVAGGGGGKEALAAKTARAVEKVAGEKTRAQQETAHSPAIQATVTYPACPVPPVLGAHLAEDFIEVK